MKTATERINEKKHYLSQRSIPDYLRNIITVKDAVILMESYANEVSREKFVKFMYATHTATHAKKIIGLYDKGNNQ